LEALAELKAEVGAEAVPLEVTVVRAAMVPPVAAGAAQEVREGLEQWPAAEGAEEEELPISTSIRRKSTLTIRRWAPIVLFRRFLFTTHSTSPSIIHFQTRSV
jgi:hypothetical protein